MSLAQTLISLVSRGFAVWPDFIGSESLAALRLELNDFYHRGEFRRAAVGRLEQAKPRDEIRGDYIHWWNFSSLTPTQINLSDHFALLKQSLNQELFLGLKTLETHYAIYPAGSFYRRHLDRFRDDDSRVVSLVLYLNEQWSTGDGGELALYPENQTVRVLPKAGTLVCFLSDQIEHEVLPTQRARQSLAGWFRR